MNRAKWCAFLYLLSTVSDRQRKFLLHAWDEIFVPIVSQFFVTQVLFHAMILTTPSQINVHVLLFWCVVLCKGSTLQVHSLLKKLSSVCSFFVALSSFLINSACAFA